jgi:threonine dehydrogenase-like Zn-dependent dehydrogenase
VPAQPGGPNETLELLVAAMSAAAMDGVRRSGSGFGDAVLVAGDDCLALLLVYWCRRQGAFPLAFAGRGPQEFFDVAAALGADDIIDLGGGAPAKQFSRAVKPESRMAAFVTSSAVLCLGAIQPLVAAHGRVTVFGGSGDTCDVNLYPHIHQRELALCGGGGTSWHAASFRGLMETSLQHLRTGDLPLERLTGGTLSADESGSLPAGTPSWKVFLASHASDVRRANAGN